MHRFFLTQKQFHNNYVEFPSNVSHQLTNVLRLQTGDLVLVLDNSNFEYTVRLGDVYQMPITGDILERKLSKNEPKVELHLFFSLTSREKFEWILQKCTEVGVSSYFPFISKRSLVQQLYVDAKKFSRWESIIKEAAEQSRRGMLPDINHPSSFQELIAMLKDNYDICFLAWEDAESQSMTLKDISVDSSLPGIKKVALIIGPEGGFAQDEINFALENNVTLLSLGRLILRMETAAVVGSAIIMHTFSS